MGRRKNGGGSPWGRRPSIFFRNWDQRFYTDSKLGNFKMEFVALGKTNLLVSRTAFGAMSLDCKEIESFGEESDEKACAMVHQAYDAGVNFFDTSHSKPVCEKRLGSALHGIRQHVLLATKTNADSVQRLRSDLHESLEALECDKIDLYQLEIENFLPVKDSQDGLYKELLSLKEKKVIKHIGIATENIELAQKAVESSLYETIQIPFNVLSGDSVLNLVKLCEEKEVGLIAMQPLNGGIVSNIPLAFGYLHQFENVIPLWGTHTQEELNQILYFNDHPPVVDEKFLQEVEHERAFFN